MDLIPGYAAAGTAETLDFESLRDTYLGFRKREGYGSRLPTMVPKTALTPHRALADVTLPRQAAVLRTRAFLLLVRSKTNGKPRRDNQQTS